MLFGSIAMAAPSIVLHSRALLVMAPQRGIVNQRNFFPAHPAAFFSSP
jgi:hypothetical protein